MDWNNKLLDYWTVGLFFGPFLDCFWIGFFKRQVSTYSSLYLLTVGSNCGDIPVNVLGPFDFLATISTLPGPIDKENTYPHSPPKYYILIKTSLGNGPRNGPKQSPKK